MVAADVILCLFIFGLITHRPIRYTQQATL